MKITKITKLKEKFKISLENGTSFSVHPSVFEDFNLYINKDISEKDVQNINIENGKNKYFFMGLKKLNQTSCSPKKLNDFLYKKGASKDEIDFVLKRLRKLNYINEDLLLEDLLSHCEAKHYGFNKIIKLANDKHLSKESISKIAYDFEREENEAIFVANQLKNRIKNKNNFQLQKTILNSLVSHGFSSTLAYDVANKVFNSNESELNMLKLDYLKAEVKFSKINDESLKEKKIIQHLISIGYKVDDIKTLKEINTYEMD